MTGRCCTGPGRGWDLPPAPTPPRQRRVSTLTGQGTQPLPQPALTWSRVICMGGRAFLPRVFLKHLFEAEGAEEGGAGGCPWTLCRARASCPAGLTGATCMPVAPWLDEAGAPVGGALPSAADAGGLCGAGPAQGSCLVRDSAPDHLRPAGSRRCSGERARPLSRPNGCVAGQLETGPQE